MRSVALLVIAAQFTFSIGCRNKSRNSGDSTQYGSETDRLQGVWAIESVEVADPKEKMSEDETEWLRLEFKGDRMTVSRKGAIKERMSFVLDRRVEPAVMRLTELDDAGDPYHRPEREWLYKFERDELVLSISLNPGPRPIEFKARKWVEPEPGFFGIPAIIVVRLKKTDVARD
jgi:uncharacterized protein (TIGR03067 family)